MNHFTRRMALASYAGLLSTLFDTGCRTQTIERDPDGRIIATLWYSYGGTNREVLLSMIEQFHREQNQYRIIPTYQGDYFEALAKLRSAIVARNAPDLTHVVGEIIPYLYEAEVLEPIEIDISDLIHELSFAGTFEGAETKKTVAIPFNRSTPIAYYNAPIFDAHKLFPPTNWEELETIAVKLIQRSGSEVTQWGYECPVDWWFWIALLGQSGGSIVDSNGKFKFAEAPGIEALQLWQRLVHKHAAMKPPPGRDYNSWQVANTDFLSGRTAMIWTSTAFLRYLEKNAKFVVRAAPLPHHVRASIPTGGTLFVIPRGIKSSAKEAAFAFLRWMISPTQAVTWATKTGYMPVSKTAISQLKNQSYYQNHPNDHISIAQLASVQKWPWNANLFRIQREALQPVLEEAVLSNRSATEILHSAALDLEKP